MKLCIFEDAEFSSLFPLAWTRPVYHLRCGITLLEEKISAGYQDLETVYHCRDYIADTLKQSTDKSVNVFDIDDYLLINGRVLYDKSMINIDLNKKGCIYCSGESEVAAVLPREKSHLLKNYAGQPLNLKELIDNHLTEQIEADVINYPWDLISHNPEYITNDFKRLCPSPAINGKIDTGVHIINNKYVHVERNAKVKPGAVLDASEGPILIDEGAVVMSNAVIEGPAYVGKRSLIKISAKIYEGTSIGEVCKVGGEVEESIIHSFSNKQHDGFLGHAYLGQWVNIGADTNNSDLKNNYHPVKVIINGKTIDTGLMFIGLIMGDHSKTGINTMFNTGTVAGVHSNIYGGGFPPKYIPSFSWGGADGFVDYDIQKAISTAQAVMARSNIALTEADELLINTIFDRTVEERRQ
ncbi:GlmU family protein [candidate division KSB1 bacterium]